MAKIIHNLLGTSKTYGGMLIPANSSHTILDEELASFQSDAKLYTALTIDPAEAAMEDSNSAGQITGVDAVKFLMDNVPVETVPASSQLTDGSKIQKVSVYKAEGSSATMVTHDWTDRCTWYTNSIQIADETLTLDTGKTYNSSKTFWIDMVHGRVYGEDDLTIGGLPLFMGGTRKYAVIVKDDGVVKVEDTDYTVNYEDGTVTFDAGYTIIGDITATFYYSTDATFVLAPTPGKTLIIEHAELQFAKNVTFPTPINFEVWVYHPDQVTYPGIKIMYQKISYKNIKDMINAANLGQGYIPAVGGLNNDVIVFPFNYATVKPFSSAIGAELRLTLDDNVPMGGEWGTATFYVLSENE